jgi:hypothetical protein
MAHIFTNNVDFTNHQLLNSVLQNLASDPSSLSNGNIYYNTAAHTLKAKLNGTYATLLTTGSFGSIDHDQLLNFVANEHVDHSAVTLTINGTSDQVTVSAGSGDITTSRTWTISLPQNIHSAATTTFGSTTLSRAGVPLSARNATDSASVQVAVLSAGNRTTPTDDDGGYISLQVENDLDSLAEFARITWQASDVTNTTKDGTLLFSVQNDNTLTARLTLNAAGVAATGALTLDGTAVALSNITLTAGAGISGGGDLSANRTFALDITELSAEASPDTGTDYGVIYDASSGTHKKVLLSNWPGGAGGHTQNTDTGTTSTSFAVDSGGTGFLLKNSAGEVQLRNLADNAYADLRVRNLVVTGTTTTVNSETVTIDDNILVLNNNETGAPSADAGIEVERGTSANVRLIWDESSDVWSVTDGTNTFPIMRKFTSLIGNGSDTDIPVTHNMGTKNVQVTMFRVADDVAVFADVTHTSTSVVTVSFATAPTTNQYRVVVSG